MVVVGAGVVGLCVALEAAGRGMATTVVESRAPGAGSTGAAGGVLSPTEPHEWQGGLGAFNARAIAGWPAFAERVEELSGLPSGVRRTGELRLVRDGAPADLLAVPELAARLGLACRRIDDAEARELEPALAPGVGGLLLEDTAAIDVDALVPALVAACRRRGVQLVEGRAVAGLLEDGEHAAGVVLDDGDQLPAGAVVACAGAWGGAAAWLSGHVRVPTRPVLGEAVLVEPAQALCRRILRTPGGAIVPRADGRLWLGTTVRECGFQARPSAGAVAAIVENARAFLPAIADAAFLAARSGLRPVSVDGLPIVGPTDREGLAVATGHGREGLIHAPLTGAAVAEALATGRWPDLVAPFSPARPLG